MGRRCTTANDGGEERRTAVVMSDERLLERNQRNGLGIARVNVR